ncbi:hypothetical protein CEXT_280621, partial [Caerostris extrusa]
LRIAVEENPLKPRIDVVLRWIKNRTLLERQLQAQLEG